MKKFERSEDLLGKMFIDALDREVHLDEKLQCIYDGRKLRVYSSKLSSYIQFPTALRRAGAVFIADVIKVGGGSRAPFYRAYRGSIRNSKNEVIG